jgi:glucose/mannose-6-phosphate isomerase
VIPPGANHNGIIGYEHPAELSRQIVANFLQSDFDHPRVQVRHRVTNDVLAQRGVWHHTVQARGTSPLAQMLSVIAIGDWVSYYLALLNGTDPTPVVAIDYPKQPLANA